MLHEHTVLAFAACSILISACAPTTSGGPAKPIDGGITDLIPQQLATGWLDIYTDDKQRAFGSAVVLDGGLILTAAHVVDDATLGTKLLLVMGQAHWPVTVVWKGQRRADDLAVLEFEPSASINKPSGAGVHLCRSGSRPGDSLAVVLPDSRQFAAAGADEMAQSGPWDAEPVADRVTVYLDEGHSGSGVFDPKSGCLAGIVSFRQARKEQAGERGLMVARYDTVFVSAMRISKILDAVVTSAR